MFLVMLLFIGNTLQSWLDSSCFLQLLLIWEGFFSPLNLKDSLAGYNIVGWRPFSLSAQCISYHSFLAFIVYAEKSTDNLMGFDLYVNICFSLAAFTVLCCLYSFPFSLLCVLVCVDLDWNDLGLSELLVSLCPFCCSEWGSFLL